MRKSPLLLAILIRSFAVALGFAAAAPLPAADKIRVLIIDGQNNHQWAITTPLLKTILENEQIFAVDVSTAPPGATKKGRGKGKQNADKVAPEAPLDTAARWAAWRPKFEDYGVIVSNYNGEAWPDEVRQRFVAFVKNGGGFVSYHAADNAFADWAEYNDTIGLGGWGGRKEKAGPYLRLRDGTWTPVHAPGPCGGHGAREPFLVENFAPEHPIMKGLPARWMHPQDELYHSLRGPAKDVTVLGHGLSSVTRENEPLLMAIAFGKGRVFHTTLGHHTEALQGLGFQITFARGTEWAATGTTSIPAPAPGILTEGPQPAVREVKAR